MILDCCGPRRITRIPACFDHLLGLDLLSGLYVQIKSSDPIPPTWRINDTQGSPGGAVRIPGPLLARSLALHLSPFSFHPKLETSLAS